MRRGTGRAEAKHWNDYGIRICGNSGWSTLRVRPRREPIQRRAISRSEAMNRAEIIQGLRELTYERQFKLAMKAACRTLQIKPDRVTAPGRHWDGLFARWAIIDVLSETMGFQSTLILADKLKRDRTSILNAKRNYRQSKSTRDRYQPYREEFLERLGRALCGDECRAKRSEARA